MKHYLLLSILLLTLIVSATFADDCDENCDVNSTIDFEELEPNVIPLTANTNLMYDRWYGRVLSRTQVYDAPNGNPKRVIEDGFNFVTMLAIQDGWVKINSDEWVQAEYVQDTSSAVSSFTGVLLPKDGLDYPMTWLLVNLYPSPEPGAEPLESLGFKWRYTRVNIYETVDVDGYRWYQIGEGQWVHQYHVAKYQPLTEIPETVDTDIWVSINLYEQVVVAYEGETPIFATLTSTGLPRWPTYEGTFHIYFRNPREYMSWGTVGDDYYSLEEVPWTMFFDDGRALHGAYWHDGFGYRRSHGCVNLSLTDSKWLYDWVSAYMGNTRSADREEGPAVYVFSSGEYDM
jgi:hypothetical protein